MRLQSVRIKNFTAIIDSTPVKLGPLTVFIGNNGAGKSSLIEALETYQSIVRDGLDIAMQRWLGIEHARHKSCESSQKSGKGFSSVRIEIGLRQSEHRWHDADLSMEISHDPSTNRMLISKEEFLRKRDSYRQDRSMYSLADGKSLFSRIWEQEVCHDDILHWQFQTLAPEHMGLPVPQQRTGGLVRLARDGSNIADYLLDIRRLDVNAFNGIVETMAFVLPYARDIQPTITSELERKTWLQLTEADFKVPGWMLSTGTLRLLALLALLRHPKPPPLIVVEEIENGLDPRSIHLIVEEIRNAVLEGITQVILTTHSPYLLDLLTLDHLVLVERDEKGQPCFRRPGNDASLTQWAKEFAPGKLYTMGNLSRIKP